MRSRRSNSSKRGACKRGVDEGRSRSSCCWKSRKRYAQERDRGAGMEVELQQEGGEMWKGVHKFKMLREGKGGTYNLLNAKWVSTEEGTHGRRVKHGLEGSGWGSSGPLCKRHNQWAEGEGPMCKRSSQ